jgi:hypothetical protein
VAGNKVRIREMSDFNGLCVDVHPFRNFAGRGCRISNKAVPSCRGYSPRAGNSKFDLNTNSLFQKEISRAELMKQKSVIGSVGNKKGLFQIYCRPCENSARRTSISELGRVFAASGRSEYEKCSETVFRATFVSLFASFRTVCLINCTTCFDQ